MAPDILRFERNRIMENGKKRIAIVGYGGMGGWHVKHILKSDVLELAGICDIREVRREKARERDIFVYEDFEAVLADPTVELLTLAVPNELHMPMAVKAMEAVDMAGSAKQVEMVELRSTY